MIAERIARAVVDADGARLWLAPGELPGGLLRRLVEFLEVREFHPIEPNLETLFLEAVGNEN